MLTLTAPHDQARRLRSLIEGAAPAAPLPATSRCRTVAVTSGKGGVGKSHLALNLAVTYAQQGAKVGLLETNFGLSSLDLLCGQNGYWNLEHVLVGARQLADVMLEGPAGVQILTGGSSLSTVDQLPESVLQTLQRKLSAWEQSLDFLIVDTGTGASPLVRKFAAAAQQVVIVTTPEATAMTDAYATTKVLAQESSTSLVLVVNQADDEVLAKRVAERICDTSRQFLRRDLRNGAAIPLDAQVPLAVRQRQPFVVAAPEAPASQAIRQLANQLETWPKPAGSAGWFQRIWTELPGIKAVK